MFNNLTNIMNQLVAMIIIINISFVNLTLYTHDHMRSMDNS